MKAIEAFAARYNEQNPNNPLKQINVGMSLNDLGDQLKKYNKKSEEILTGLSFSKYGKKNHFYDGDWQSEQYIVWLDDSRKTNR